MNPKTHKSADRSLNEFQLKQVMILEMPLTENI